MSERLTDAKWNALTVEEHRRILARDIFDVIRGSAGETSEYDMLCYLDAKLRFAQEKALRAAEQPPTPPAGRGEERERIEEIRAAVTFEGSVVTDNAIIRDLLAAVESRDAVIAGLVKVLEPTEHHPDDRCVCGYIESSDHVKAALAAYRQHFPEPKPDVTKEPR